jgi:hypothetical protein
MVCVSVALGLEYTGLRKTHKKILMKLFPTLVFFADILELKKKNGHFPSMDQKKKSAHDFF